jgi:chemotaxis family two-component system sensor histidine kinase/response regulator PixL
MAIDTDIRDQAYGFFIQEAPELLQVIETELLTLRSERTTAKVHSMMRAAHSIKGGSASVGLETIKTLAHHLEDIFKALHHEELEIDAHLETLLLQAYDCLRLPLMEQITTGYFDAEQAIASSEPVFAQIEAQLGDFLGGEEYLPSSVELGIDITLSIFEVDVAQGLERLAEVLAHPEGNEIAGELRAQAEVFSGIAELLNLPGFGAIAQTTLAALDAHPNRAIEIAQLALADFQVAQQEVIAGDRTSGGAPGVALSQLAAPSDAPTQSPRGTVAVSETPAKVTNGTNDYSTLYDNSQVTDPSLDDIFGSSGSPSQTPEMAEWFEVEEIDSTAFNLLESIPEIDPFTEQEQLITPSLKDIFGSSVSSSQSTEDLAGFEFEEINADPIEIEDFSPNIDIFSEEEQVDSPSLTEIFGSSLPSTQTTEITDWFDHVIDKAALQAAQDIGEVYEEKVAPIPSLDEIFRISTSNTQSQATADLFDFELTTESQNLGLTEEIPDGKVKAITSIDELLGISVSPDQDRKITKKVGVDIVESLESTAKAADSIRQIKPVTPEEANSETPSLDDIFDISISKQKDTEIPDIFDIELPETSVIETVEEIQAVETATEREELLNPSLDEVFGNLRSPDQTTEPPQQHLDVETPDFVAIAKAPNSIQEIVESIEQVFDSLPTVKDLPASNATAGNSSSASPNGTANSASVASAAAKKKAAQDKKEGSVAPSNSTPQLSVRVDLARLERMNNLVGELAINRNSLSLQNEQLQGTVQELLRRFGRFQEMANHLRDLSDHMLVAPERQPSLQHSDNVEMPDSVENLDGSRSIGEQENAQRSFTLPPSAPTFLLSSFDSLEMDSYGELHSLLQDTLEEMVQLEEIVGDVTLLAGQSNQTLEGQRQMIAHLRDDLMWARMLPLGEVLSRFPRTLRDLSTTYHKQVDLKLSGTGVLVDKAVLEKLYDPLLHLLRNAFDHGIEPPEMRMSAGKPQSGQIEIRAYHQGSQTVIEVRDDGGGVNIDRIRSRAVEIGLLSPEQLPLTPIPQILELIFEPGFSTASKVSELSGRGVGLDVVRSQLRALKGTVTVHSTPGRGTSFTLRIPLTLTIAKLLVCMVGTTAYALPSDSIEEILIPNAVQMKQSGKQRFLHWRKRILPVYHLSELLEYSCPLPESIPSQALVSVPTPEDWAAPMLLIRKDNQFMALEVDRLVTEQELVIKPLGEAIAPPGYIYGCTILGDGSLIPVIDGATLLNQIIGQDNSSLASGISLRNIDPATLSDLPASPRKTPLTPRIGVGANTAKSPLILVVDDSIALRQTLALTLQKVGYRVLQARDGREAIEQLQQNSSIQLVVCDIEMPNMNGFEFLSQRRQDALLSKVPVVMLTSRSSDKHRRLATHLGASAYFTKPYLEQEFLAALKSFIDKGASVGATPVLASS